MISRNTHTFVAAYPYDDLLWELPPSMCTALQRQIHPFRKTNYTPTTCMNISLKA